MAKFLDENGLKRLWTSIKDYVSQQIRNVSIEDFDPVWELLFQGNKTANSVLSTGLTYDDIKKYRFLVVTDASNYNYIVPILSNYLYGTTVYNTTVRSIYFDYSSSGILQINKFQSGTLGSNSLTSISSSLNIWGVI